MRSQASTCALALLALAGCTVIEVTEVGPGGGSGTTKPPGEQAPGDPKKAVTPATRFLTDATEWTVPDGGWAGRGFSDVATGRWATIDLDGDQKPDLVVPADPQASDPKVFGYGKSPHWRVYKNTGSGFAEASEWTVPDGGWAGRGFSDVATGRWATIDLDGDLKPDLVVPADPQASDPKVFGYGKSPYWRVYKNTGSGFAEASEWTVPDGGWAGRGFSDVATGRWATIDLDGDQKPDLVVPADPQASDPKVFGYGKSPHWRVYKNTGSGFAEASEWTIPDGGWAGRGFSDVATGRWATIDLDGDQKPDLVVPADPQASDPKVYGYGKAPHWRVYKNTGSGFAEASEWTVPDGGWAGRGFSDVATGRWATVDLDGDQKPDLVVPADPQASDPKVFGYGKAPHWRVYKNTGSGFAEASEWTVPDGGWAGRGFSDVATGRWTTTDLDGDHRPDLVVPADPQASDAKVHGYGAGPFWQVFKGMP